MRVGIDIAGMFWKYRTGVQNLYYGLIEGLAMLADETQGIEFVLIDRSLQQVHALPFKLLPGFEFRTPGAIHHLPTLGAWTAKPGVGKIAQIWNRGVREIARHATGWQRRAAHMVADLDVLEGWDVWLRIAPKAKRIIIITDVIPILFQSYFSDEAIRNLKRALQFAKAEADCVITISHHARQTLMQTASIPGEKIRVVYPGVRSIFKPLDDRSAIMPVLRRYDIPDRPYMLSVGFLDPRKNIKAHIKAFESIADRAEFRDLQFVLAGPTSLATSEVLRDINSTHVRQRVHITGYVSDDDLPVILNGASVLAYCSLFEGFGFPALEAMACGVPVITSNTTSLPEITGGAALLVDPNKADQIADAMIRIMSSESLRRQMRERGLEHVKAFTWENWARGHLKAYRECYPV